MTDPHAIFHYTDAAGLLGILTSGQIWATDILYLNDASEHEYGLQLARETLEEMAEEAGLSTAARAILCDLDRVRNYARNTHTFTACFCREGDLLSQWRGYSGGVGGYSIGFDFKELKARVKASPSSALWQVIYDRAQQGESLRKYFAEPFEALVKASQEENQPPMEAIRKLWVAVYVDTVNMKHPTFEAEHEYRLISSRTRESSKQRFRFRPAGPFVVPYIELDLRAENDKLPLTEVRIGPTTHPDLADRSARALLDSLGYDPSLVCSSSIPLRA